MRVMHNTRNDKSVFAAASSSMASPWSLPELRECVFRAQRHTQRERESCDCIATETAHLETEGSWIMQSAETEGERD